MKQDHNLEDSDQLYHSLLFCFVLFFFFHGWRTVTYNIYATNFLLGSVPTMEILAATPVTTDASKTGVT